MEYKDFLEMIQQEVVKRAGAGAAVHINHVVKNNSTLQESMTILQKGENVSPAIYLPCYYERWKAGTSIGILAEEILEFYYKNKVAGKFDIRFYLDFEKVKGKITCKLIHYERNLPVLERIPHEKFLDLALVYYYELENEIFGSASILIQNSHLSIWKIDQKTLHCTAVSNTLQLSEYEFVEVSELVEQMTGIVLDERIVREMPMYVLTNKKKNFGAVTLYFREVLEAIGERLQTDFYVLPSSVHECMVVPAQEENEQRRRKKIQEYQNMVQEINQEFVEHEEILSDAVYYYFRDRKELAVVSENVADNKAVSG